MNAPQTDRIIQPSWLARPSTEIAPDLLGCTLVRHFPNQQTMRGIIVETEAYGPEDPACHAYRRRTPRNQIMFAPAGFSYIYLIYGIHHCFNVVTDGEGIASAVLIRALELETPPPITGKKQSQLQRLAAGPGKLCRALQIDLSLSSLPLSVGQSLWLEHRTPEFQQKVNDKNINFVQTSRIGISTGTDLHWRWYVAGSVAVSRF